MGAAFYDAGRRPGTPRTRGRAGARAGRRLWQRGGVQTPRHAIFTPEHDALRASVRRFVDTEIRPFVDDWEAAGRFPDDVFRRCGELGFLGLHYPARWGGSDGDLASGVSTILVDPSEGDMDAYVGALRKASALGCRIVLPGHGPPLAPEALAALLAHRLERESKVLAAIAGGSRPLAEIADAAYDDLPGLPLFLRARQALAHLVSLERRGAARRTDPEGRAWARAGS